MATQKRCPHGHCQRTPAIFSSPKGLFLSAAELTARQTHCLPRHSQLRRMGSLLSGPGTQALNAWSRILAPIGNNQNGSSPVTVVRYMTRRYLSSSKGVAQCMVERLSHRMASPTLHLCR